jgi:hypothetical protein
MLGAGAERAPTRADRIVGSGRMGVDDPIAPLLDTLLAIAQDAEGRTGRGLLAG